MILPDFIDSIRAFASEVMEQKTNSACIGQIIGDFFHSHSFNKISNPIKKERIS